jgi:hypothetical protein
MDAVIGDEWRIKRFVEVFFGRFDDPRPPSACVFSNGQMIVYATVKTLRLPFAEKACLTLSFSVFVHHADLQLSLAHRK